MPSLWLSDDSGAFVPLKMQGYATEGSFQEMLAANPALLAGAVEDSETPWLLVDRELPIKAEESDVGTWSLDHLFVASDGRPVLVEVKRSSDPRARREVVAQMLDYAASFAYEWSADRLRERWQSRVAPDAKEEAMVPLLEAGEFEREDDFWTAVQTKIDAGHVRLLFGADRLSPTLVRIIEYLNDQLQKAEVGVLRKSRRLGLVDRPDAVPTPHDLPELGNDDVDFFVHSNCQLIPTCLRRRTCPQYVPSVTLCRGKESRATSSRAAPQPNCDFFNQPISRSHRRTGRYLERFFLRFVGNLPSHRPTTGAGHACCWPATNYGLAGCLPDPSPSGGGACYRAGSSTKVPGWTPTDTPRHSPP